MSQVKHPDKTTVSRMKTTRATRPITKNEEHIKRSRVLRNRKTKRGEENPRNVVQKLIRRILVNSLPRARKLSKKKNKMHQKRGKDRKNQIITVALLSLFNRSNHVRNNYLATKFRSQRTLRKKPKKML